MPDVRDVSGDAVTDIALGDMGTVCHYNRECDDHVYCNGVERCAPSEPGANPLGCVAAAMGVESPDRALFRILTRQARAAATERPSPDA